MREENKKDHNSVASKHETNTGFQHKVRENTFKAKNIKVL